MTDIALQFTEGDLTFDIAMAGADLLSDQGMKTAICISLFSDARAAPDDELPTGSSDRRGWCGDTYAAIAGDQTGSKLWLLARSKITSATLSKVREYAQAALQWLVDDGVAASVTVTVQQVDVFEALVSAKIQRPSGERLHYDYVWSAM